MRVSGPATLIGLEERVVSLGPGLAGTIGTHLRRMGARYLVTEPAHPVLPVTVAERLQYGRYSARYGELPTSRHLVQLIARAYGSFHPKQDIWMRGARFVDPFRVFVQPDGFTSRSEYFADRRQHFRATRQALTEADVFVVTLGGDEVWLSTLDGAAFSAGPEWNPDPAHTELTTLAPQAIVEDLSRFVDDVARVNPRGRVILVRDREAELAGAVPRWAKTLDTVFDAAARLERVTAWDSCGASGSAAAALLLGMTARDDPPPSAAVSVSADEHRATVDTLIRALCDERMTGDTFKCVIWDLDNTLWLGTLLEQDEVRLRDGIANVIQTLDSRGILQSVASRGDAELALAKLDELGLRQYFLHPQINWGSKADSIAVIAEQLGFAHGALLFVDDQQFERDEVSYRLPDVVCVDERAIAGLLDDPRLDPALVTDDARQRRELYLREQQRVDAQRQFAGSGEGFLTSLGLRFTIARMRPEDLPRAQELIARTHQFNSTGYRYDRTTLERLCASDEHLLLMGSLEDRYGSYGQVGLCIVELHANVWIVRLLLMSCRVLSRGVATVFLDYLTNLAGRAGVRLRAEMVPTARNAPLRQAFIDAELEAVDQIDEVVTFEPPVGHRRRYPPHIHVAVMDERRVRRQTQASAPEGMFA